VTTWSQNGGVLELGCCTNEGGERLKKEGCCNNEWISPAMSKVFMNENEGVIIVEKEKEVFNPYNVMFSDEQGFQSRV